MGANDLSMVKEIKNPFIEGGDKNQATFDERVIKSNLPEVANQHLWLS